MQKQVSGLATFFTFAFLFAIMCGYSFVCGSEWFGLTNTEIFNWILTAIAIIIIGGGGFIVLVVFITETEPEDWLLIIPLLGFFALLAACCIV